MSDHYTQLCWPKHLLLAAYFHQVVVGSTNKGLKYLSTFNVFAALAAKTIFRPFLLGLFSCCSSLSRRPLCENYFAPSKRGVWQK